VSLKAIEPMVNAYPEALRAAGRRGDAPIPCAILCGPQVQSSGSLHLLQRMIKIGGPDSPRRKRINKDGRVVSTRETA
jgi:hypothetical protein